MLVIAESLLVPGSNIFSKFKINCYKYNRHHINTDQIISMNPSVSLLMGYDCKCKCYRFTHEHFAGAHTFHVELEFRIVGKTEVSRKKKTSQSKGRRTNNKLNPHNMVSMLYIKSVITLNHNTTFASRSVL